MKKIFLLISIFTSFIFISNCQCRTDDIIVNIRYVGNFDLPMDILLTNITNLKKREIYQSVYEVEEKCMMQNVKTFVINHHSKETHKINKLKITIFTNKKEQVYFFNGKDGIDFIDFLINNTSVKTNSKNKYANDAYFKESELSSIKYQLKTYSGKEWMYD